MTDPAANLQRVVNHAQHAGLGPVDYTLELEDILEAIVAADLDRDDQDMHGALMRARTLVETWGQP